jgi:2-keto-4-pentenoate hydratase/2-oxohepta-3-ene-1,7-dioic acid hydratase in catechol pathway
MFCFLSLLSVGCSPTMVKQNALDKAALETRLPDNSLIQTVPGGERKLTPGPLWLASLKPQKELTFLGVQDEGGQSYGAILEIDLINDRLRYLPLMADETPLSILAKPERRVVLEKLVKIWDEGRGSVAENQIREVLLHEVSERLTFPIPQPRQIFAVAANYPSHLFDDLSLPRESELIELLQLARPRLFQKYPPVAAPGDSLLAKNPYAVQPGPFGSIAAPAQVRVPTQGDQSRSVTGHLDYEVEIAVLIGRDLSWDEAHAMSDTELRRTVAGYLLFSDAKVRDPQAMGKILQAFREEKVNPDNPYRVGDAALDGTLGLWNEMTCHWWSYAASWGHYAAYGPLLVASSDKDEFPPRMILSGRSYSSSSERSVPPPQPVPKDQLLMRQATVTTLAAEYQDALIWDIPTIIRSLLNPAGNALAFTGEAPVLYAGDLIALGTPGGTVVSAKPWWLLPMAENLFFWKDPKDFYKMFFKSTEADYLHPGDKLFLWGEGLGYQLLQVDKPRGELSGM